VWASNKRQAPLHDDHHPSSVMCGEGETASFWDGSQCIRRLCTRLFHPHSILYEGVYSRSRSSSTNYRLTSKFIQSSQQRHNPPVLFSSKHQLHSLQICGAHHRILTCLTSTHLLRTWARSRSNSIAKMADPDVDEDLFADLYVHELLTSENRIDPAQLRRR
jgi:hypothetical protein